MISNCLFRLMISHLPFFFFGGLNSFIIVIHIFKRWACEGWRPPVFGLVVLIQLSKIHVLLKCNKQNQNWNEQATPSQWVIIGEYSIYTICDLTMDLCVCCWFVFISIVKEKSFSRFSHLLHAAHRTDELSKSAIFVWFLSSNFEN